MPKVKKLYSFDEKAEYKIYKKICKKPDKSLTYLQWKDHILSHIISIEKGKNTNIENFKHYLIYRQRQEKIFLHGLVSLLIPAFIFFLTVYFTLPEVAQLPSNLILFINIIITFIIIAVFGKEYSKTSMYINFFDDVIQIINEYKSDK